MSLTELVNEPFGPYLEEHVLINSSRLHTTSNNPLALDAVIFEFRGQKTGLTECEPSMPECRQEQVDNVRFLGTLTIKSLSWLTDPAKHAINKELRDRESRIRSNKHRLGVNNLTLETLYAPSLGFESAQPRIKVTIIAKKNMTSTYLSSYTTPDGLEIHSAAHRRRYKVASMDICSYELSRLFISRYRLHYIIKTLLQIDADSNIHEANTTPVEKRTPEWFVNLYMKHMAYSASARQHRPIYDSSDSDIESGTSGRMKARRKHTLRHVSRAEIRYRIWEHAEWLIGQITPRHQLFDVTVWKRWLHKVNRLQHPARESGPRPRGNNASVLLDDAMDIDGLPLPHPKPAKKQRQRNIPHPEQFVPSRFTHPPHSADEDSSDAEQDLTRLRTYDRDFSPVSSDSELSSDSDDLPERPSTPPDPDLLALLPPAFFHPPRLTHSMKWVCAVPRCRYGIDLLNLTDENLDTPHVSVEEKRRLRSKRWSIGDVWVREAFAYMVDKHYEEHLHEWGIEFKEVNGQWKACWRDPHHPRSHRLRVVKEDNRRPKTKVKEEDR